MYNEGPCTLPQLPLMVTAYVTVVQNENQGNDWYNY